jgi:hypothetical protein
VSLLSLLRSFRFNETTIALILSVLAVARIAAVNGGGNFGKIVGKIASRGRRRLKLRKIWV